MKKLRQLRIKIIKGYSQLRADTIIHQLETSKNSIHFDHWFNQGAILNAYMVEFYGIYLK